MAIAKENRKSKTCDNTPQSIPEAYDTITVSDRATPLDMQAACTEGSPWVVTYYRSRLGRNNEQRFADSELSPSFQSYVRIKNLTLRLLSPVTPTVEDGINASAGTAIVSSFTPIVGDSFVGALLHGVYYMFNVVEVTPMSFLATTAYTISFELVCLADVNSVRVRDLTTKTYKTLIASETGGACGQPLITEESAKIKDELSNTLNLLMNEYLRLFLDADTDLFILETDGMKLYDNHLTQFILRTWEFEHTELGRRVRGISPDISERIYRTLWDDVSGRTNILVTTKEKMGMISSNAYKYNWTQINTMAHRVDWIVGHGDENIGSVVNIQTTYPTAASAIPELEYKSVVSPIYRPVTDDEFYVLSEDFYRETGGTVLDRMTRDYINGESIDETLLLTMVNNWKMWPMTNKYWQTPLLVLLMRYTLADKSSVPITGDTAVTQSTGCS